MIFKDIQDKLLRGSLENILGQRRKVPQHGGRSGPLHRNDNDDDNDIMEILAPRRTRVSKRGLSPQAGGFLSDMYPFVRNVK